MRFAWTPTAAPRLELDTMDPTDCYLEMYRAMRDGNDRLAREKALSLRTWLDAGGFWPQFYSREEVTGYLASVLRRTGGCGVEKQSSD